MLNIVGVKTNKGYYISTNTKGKSYHNPVLTSYIVNDKTVEKTFHKDWFFIDTVPEKIQQKMSQPNINHRYELIDKEIESEKFPLVFKREDVAYYDDYECYWVWKDEYSKYRSLYEEKYDRQEPILEDVEFEFEEVLSLDIDKIDEPKKFSYSVQRTRYSSDGTKELTNKNVRHQLMDKILFPSIVMHQRPCKLTSKQVYDILRQYIKQNINYEVAKISSDYNFCFTVEKLIALDEPYTKETEIKKNNGKSYAKKRYNRRYVSKRSVKIFEMTYSPENYKGYKPIKGIEANNEEELAEKIEALCESTIEMINEPLIDCPHCKGMGVILE